MQIKNIYENLHCQDSNFTHFGEVSACDTF